MIATSGALTSIISNPFDITLAPPSGITVTDPGATGSDSTPTVQVSGVDPNDIVKLYTDSACSSANLVGSYTVPTGQSFVDITTTVLADGTYDFYASRTSSGGTPSTCSTATDNYVLTGAWSDNTPFLNNNFGNWDETAGTRSWKTNTGDTATTGVGPTNAASGTHYAYTEASNPTGAGDDFILLSPTLDGSAHNLAISFQWNKRGDNMGDLYFEASNDGGTTWNTLWSHTGADIATNGTDIWRSKWIDICGTSPGYNSANVKLRFRAVMPSSGTIGDSDIGIDEINVNDGGCLPAPPAEVAITTPTTSDIIGVTNQNSFTIGGTCSDNGENVTLSGDVAGVTTCSSGTWSVNLDLSHLADGNVTIQADHTSAGGGPTGSDSVTVVKDSVTIQFDDFETLGNWTQDTANDNWDFTATTGDTPTVGVGPTSGQGGSGTYMYTEASTPTTNSDVFILESNSLDADTYDMDFKFYWNKRGNTMGDLYVDVSPDNGTTWDNAVFSHTGADVAKGGADVWNLETLDLCNLGYNSGTLKVRFRIVMPASGNPRDSDIGIDSVRVTTEGCQ